MLVVEAQNRPRSCQASTVTIQIVRQEEVAAQGTQMMLVEVLMSSNYKGIISTKRDMLVGIAEI